jgi:hypothetical protein
MKPERPESLNTQFTTGAPSALHARQQETFHMATTLSTYDQQAKTFLESNNLRLRITLYPADMQAPPKWAFSESGQRVERHGLKYRVVLTRSDNIGQLSFDFWDSIHNREQLEKVRVRVMGRKFRPSDYDVLACISSDQYCPDTFADFCSEYGYETDSRKALAMFRRCRYFAKRIRAFFTEAELTQLAEIQ